MATEKWTMEGPDYSHEEHIYVAIICESGVGAPKAICRVRGWTEETCRQRADLICAAPGQAVRIKHIDANVGMLARRLRNEIEGGRMCYANLEWNAEMLDTLVTCGLIEPQDAEWTDPHGRGTPESMKKRRKKGPTDG